MAERNAASAVLAVRYVGEDCLVNIRNLCLASAVACVSSVVSAQNGTQTIVLMPEGAELPAAVTRVIDLPKNENGEYRPAAAAVEHSARGLAIANEARENGRAFGEAMAAQAQENRENKARGGRPDPRRSRARR